MPLQLPIVRPGSRRGKPEPPRSWRERLAAARHLPKLLRLVWSTEPRFVVGIVVLRVLRAVVPLAVLWIGKLIVDAVHAAAATATHGGTPPWRHLGVLVVAEMAIALAGEGLSRLSALLESLLGDLFANRTSVELMRHAATLDLEQL
jgi:ATP-binding cassette subfamily B protein